MIFSCVIPAKSLDDPKLKDLLASIRAQDFPQDQIETIVVTEGDSEQAKTIGIRKAKGEICAMFCADNYVTNRQLFKQVYSALVMDKSVTGVYNKYYQTVPQSNSLDRYFALIGGNDVIPFYLGKNDRKPWYDYDESEISSYIKFPNTIPSLGDNGFFYRRDRLIQADLDHYYPMDCAEDLRRLGYFVYERINSGGVWHRTTDGNLIKFLIKRYRYARDLYSDRDDRRWKMLDTREDYWRLTGFILATLTVIPCLYISIKGFLKVRDFAWFWHPISCLGFLITYGILVCRNGVKKCLTIVQKNAV